MTTNRTSEAADNLLYSIEERSKLPSPVASWMPPMLAVIQKYKAMERTLEKVQFQCGADAGGTCHCDAIAEALSYDPL